jgi:thymidylate kinase
VERRLVTSTAGPAVGRRVLRAQLVELLDAHAVRWAWQGPRGAPESWDDSVGPADLDVWCDTSSAPTVASAVDAWPASRVADATDPRRLRHISWVVESDSGAAVLDLTFGDLRVGPVLLVDEGDVVVDSVHRLSGAAGAADLLVRPLLRGRVPGSERVAEARASWAEAIDRPATAARWARELGDALAADVVRVLDGAEPDPDLASRVRRRLMVRTLAPAGLGAAWAQRHSILPAGRSAGPVGLRTRGVVVVLVGTDGAGKSTVAAQLEQRLRSVGLGTRSAYFGMARGNLPGVGLARRLLGVAAAGDGDGEPQDLTPDAALVVPDALPDLAEQRRDLGHPTLRRMAAWYYAGEYALRYLTTVAPAVRRREVVLCDRYVYDLRESPWPGSAAARAVERLVPRPDVLVLPDAPVELIHRRKPERSFAGQWAQQTRFRALVAERPARVAALLVDTSGAPGDNLAAVVSAVLTAAHRPRR